MINWGVSAGYHDASLSVVKDGQIVFAGHAERYSRYKNDKHLNGFLIEDALSHGEPDVVYWYENPLLKATRRIYSGQKNIWTNPKKYLIDHGYKPRKMKWGNHHRSHMAAGYYTRPFEDCATLVIDAIGEWITTSIWRDETMVWSKRYPNSLGLFYSAFTDRIGLKANEDEYILMGMAAYGDKHRFKEDLMKLVDDKTEFHRGVKWWKPELKEEDYFDVAASVQHMYESELASLLYFAGNLTKRKKLVFMGGCALNCLANRLIPVFFDDYWIMPNPGDAGSSLGAVLAGTEQRVEFETPYLGHKIEGEYPSEEILGELDRNGIVGVANGCAEFGPRALGNRSLLADPRGEFMKSKVNAIKKRQEFRPFAPVIREEDAHKCFNVSRGFSSPYMQEIVTCKDPEKYPAIVHKDGTSRVQTVNQRQHSGLYEVLTHWKHKTGCPMLLNTSLNIKGEPIVNDINDANRFEKKYNVKVFK
jgi:carbamoyltransferase